MANQIFFPSMLFGSFADVERKTKKAASQLKEMLLSGNMVILDQLPEESVQVGELVYTNFNTDLNLNSSHWRLYVLRRFFSVLPNELAQIYGEASLGSVVGIYERTSWGTLEACIGHVAPNSLSHICIRLKVILEAWEGLSSLRYIDQSFSPVDLESLLLNHLSGLFEMWLDQPELDVKTAISKVIEKSKCLTDNEILERLTDGIIKVAPTINDVRGIEFLMDRAFVSERLSQLKRFQFYELTGGYYGHLRQAAHLLIEPA